MIYPYPKLALADLEVIGLIQGQRAQLKLGEPESKSMGRLLATKHSCPRPQGR